MEFSTCPNCKEKVKRKWFRAVCYGCNIELKESNLTHAISIFIPIIGLVIAMYIGKQGTSQIVNQSPPNLSTILFKYYMSILVVTWAITGSINYIVRNYFSIYES
jgi:hypothetical protein